MSKKTSGRNATAKQNEYISKAYDRITLLVPKGDKEKIKDAAERAGVSVNAYITRALDEMRQRDDAPAPARSARGIAPACSASAPARDITDVPTPPRGEGVKNPV